VQIQLPRAFSEVATDFPGVDFEIFSGSAPQGPSLARTTMYIIPYGGAPGSMQVMAEMPQLEVAQLLWAGVEYARPFVPPGVRLCNGRGIHDAATAELAVGLAIASLRGMAQSVRNQQAKTWSRDLDYKSLADRRVTILGYGSIGAAIEARMVPFEVEITRIARHARTDPVVHAIEDLDKILRTTEVLMVVVPLTKETTRLLDARHLSLLPDGATVINVARGLVIDTDALVAELKQGRLSAALDVVDPEPLPPMHPLWEMPNCIITPHVGGGTSAFWPRAKKLVRENISRYVNNQPLLNEVSADY
jgi:phosphoglycerate dehydrogenase-like enzyme